MSDEEIELILHDAIIEEIHTKTHPKTGRMKTQRYKIAIKKLVKVFLKKFSQQEWI